MMKNEDESLSQDRLASITSQRQMELFLLVICLLFLSLNGLDFQRHKFVKVINVIDRHFPYSTAWDLQLDLLQHHLTQQDSLLHIDSGGDICVGTVIVCQHNPTYTLGSATTEGSGPFSKEQSDGTFLEYETFKVERAGQATFHGPGQLVVYPILDLNHFSKDIHLYLRLLEQVIMETLTHYEIQSKRIEGLTGVWAIMPDEQESKIAAIGIKLRRWITMHGLSLNVCPDMRYFDNIVPCGITDRSVASMKQIKEQRVRIAEDLKLLDGGQDSLQDSENQIESVEPYKKSVDSLTSTSTSTSSSLLSCSDSHLMGDVASVALDTLSRVLAVECRALNEEDAQTYVHDITRTYGPLRENFELNSDASVSTANSLI